MAGRAAELTGIIALAALVTVLMSASVLRAPSERVFGMAIVGRHHDPFTVMAQFDGAPLDATYSQPVTDIPGRLAAKIIGGVAAYNGIVLLSFPFAAAMAFLLARQLGLASAGAALAAMAYAFSPFHVAHAAYHPHIAQVEWIPLYLLALWRCLDRASAAAMALLVAATAAVTLSNFYGGLIAAVITPAAILAYWLVRRRSTERPGRSLGLTITALVIASAAGVAYAAARVPLLFRDRTALAFSPADLLRYSADARSFVVPPVAHPLFGGVARHFWEAAGVREGLLEQQVFLGWSLIALAVIGIGAWLHFRREPRVAAVPVLVVVAAVAFLFALWPPAWLYHALPMFRSYARFGVVIQLMTALLAGVGFDALRRRAAPRARMFAVALAVLIVGEYAVSPRAMSRDVLPTMAHRWVASQTEPIRALDCVPFSQESQSISRLSGQRIAVAGAAIDCLEPEFAAKLAANGFTHLVVRSGAPAAGFRRAATFPDSAVFEVIARRPAVYTAAMSGFSPREQDASWSWRWMGADGTWTIRSTVAAPVFASLDLELSAFHHVRQLDVRLDGKHLAALVVEEQRRPFVIGPFVVTSGDHSLTFHAREPPTIADTLMNNADTRPLSFAIGAWHWAAGSAK